VVKAFLGLPLTAGPFLPAQIWFHFDFPLVSPWFSGRAARLVPSLGRFGLLFQKGLSSSERVQTQTLRKTTSVALFLELLSGFFACKVLRAFCACVVLRTSVFSVLCACVLFFAALPNSFCCLFSLLPAKGPVGPAEEGSARKTVPQEGLFGSQKGALSRKPRFRKSPFCGPTA
jgi:hypothetical protein